MFHTVSLTVTSSVSSWVQSSSARICFSQIQHKQLQYPHCAWISNNQEGHPVCVEVIIICCTSDGTCMPHLNCVWVLENHVCVICVQFLSFNHLAPGSCSCSSFLSGPITLPTFASTQSHFPAPNGSPVSLLWILLSFSLMACMSMVALPPREPTASLHRGLEQVLVFFH